MWRTRVCATGACGARRRAARSASGCESRPGCAADRSPRPASSSASASANSSGSRSCAAPADLAALQRVGRIGIARRDAARNRRAALASRPAPPRRARAPADALRGSPARARAPGCARRCTPCCSGRAFGLLEEDVDLALGHLDAVRRPRARAGAPADLAAQVVAPASKATPSRSSVLAEIGERHACCSRAMRSTARSTCRSSTRMPVSRAICSCALSRIRRSSICRSSTGRSGARCPGASAARSAWPTARMSSE